MVKEQIATYFIFKQKFLYMGTNQPDISVVYKPVNAENVDVCIIANFTVPTVYPTDYLTNIEYEIEKKLLLNGYRKVGFHYIIISNNIQRDRVYGESGISFWLIDNQNLNLIVYEDQIEGYYDCEKELDLLFEEELNKNKFNLKKSLKRLKYFPIITAILVALNVIIFLALEMNGNTEDSRYMLEHGAMYWEYLFENHEYYRLLTAVFLHFGFDHLFNNMLTLIFVGHYVEKFVGHIRFTIIYLVGGIGANIASAVYHMNNSDGSVIVSAGASGAIFAIIGAMVILMIMSKSVRNILRPNTVMLMLILTLSNGYTSQGIDNMAHLSGLLIGFIVTFICCAWQKSTIQ